MTCVPVAHTQLTAAQSKTVPQAMCVRMLLQDVLQLQGLDAEHISELLLSEEAAHPN